MKKKFEVLTYQGKFVDETKLFMGEDEIQFTNVPTLHEPPIVSPMLLSPLPPPRYDPEVGTEDERARAIAMVSLMFTAKQKENILINSVKTVIETVTLETEISKN